jgi:hypothetical protein
LKHARRRAAPAAVFAIAIAAILGGCGTTTNDGTHITSGSSPWVVGSGKSITATRQLDAFHALSVDGPLDVTVSIGSTSSATIEADDNLIPLIGTQVADGKLTISLASGLQTTNPLKVRLTTANLDSLAQKGASTIDFEAVSASALSVDVDEASTLRAGGRATSLALTVGGASTADLRNVSTEVATVHLDSASTAYVKASSSVGGECISASTLLVSGGAMIDVRSDVSSTVKAE